MSWRGARPRRLFGASALAGLGLYSLVTIASAPATVLAAGCSKSSPQADVAVTQSAAGTYVNNVAQSVTFTVTAENEGPCSADVTLVDKVADTSFPTLTITTVSTNPSSATCNPAAGSATTSGTITCTFAKLSAPSDANTNNPGTGVVIFTVSSGTTPLGGPNAAPVTSVGTVSTSLTDPQLGNNTSKGAFLLDGGSLTYDGFQSTTITVAKGQGIHGSAEIFSGVNDPNPPKGSFGQIVRINSDAFLDSGGNPISPLQTVTFDVPITSSTPQSVSKVHVWHELDGTTTWVQLPACNTGNTNLPCVFSITKLKGGPTGAYFEVIVYTTVTSKWIT